MKFKEEVTKFAPATISKYGMYLRIHPRFGVYNYTIGLRDNKLSLTFGFGAASFYEGVLNLENKKYRSQLFA